MKKSLAYTFADEHLLRQALTHRSANGPNNERLEFLGDAVLQVIVSDIVFMQKPEASEGQLSRLRSSVVRDVTLAEVALELGLGEHVFLGSGERKSGGHRRESILSDTLEAIFGAVYLDAGFDAARQVICTAYGDRLQNMPDGADLRDPKSRLQELLQGRGLALPVYAVENVTGKAHKQSFEVSCTIPELETATTGRGSTRRDAEQEAALAMLDAVDKIE
ncbi:MAG: ribonuclease III [Gammaproteobacteria bacterium]|nr:MAG: ribonuclease III [Gammaproteobacteria bacterium]